MARQKSKLINRRLNECLTEQVNFLSSGQMDESSDRWMEKSSKRQAIWPRWTTRHVYHSDKYRAMSLSRVGMLKGVILRRWIIKKSGLSFWVPSTFWNFHLSQSRSDEKRQFTSYKATLSNNSRGSSLYSNPFFFSLFLSSPSPSQSQSSSSSSSTLFSLFLSTSTCTR